MSLSNPKISLIIPVYNVEKYIRKTLESVLAQTFTDYEVIMVNDGSTDGSLAVLKEYADKYENFKLINQNNCGSSKARNVGINEAAGDYLAFLDSDDFLKPDFLEVLYSSAEESGADIACCNYYLYYEKNKKKVYMPFTAKTGVYSNEMALKKLILDISFHFFMWNKLFKRSLFIENDIVFYDMYFEDVAICPQLFFYANKVSFVNKALYYYRRHEGSIISLIDAPKTNDFIKSLGVIRNFLEEKNVYEKYKAVFKIYAFRFKFQVGYCIVTDHIDKLSFSDVGVNLKRAYLAINLFKSDKYVPTNNPPILPLCIKEPVSKRKVFIR